MSQYPFQAAAAVALAVALLYGTPQAWPSADGRPVPVVLTLASR